jgi:hypothetical protein
MTDPEKFCIEIRDNNMELQGQLREATHAAKFAEQDAVVTKESPREHKNQFEQHAADETNNIRVQLETTTGNAARDC